MVAYAEEMGILYRTERQFADVKHLIFFSLNIEVISNETIAWILTSLRND